MPTDSDEHLMYVAVINVLVRHHLQDEVAQALGHRRRLHADTGYLTVDFADHARHYCTARAIVHSSEINYLGDGGGQKVSIPASQAAQGAQTAHYSRRL